MDVYAKKKIGHRHSNLSGDKNKVVPAKVAIEHVNLLKNLAILDM